MAADVGRAPAAVRVLGPVEVRDGDQVTRPAGKVRDLLAHLVAVSPYWIDASDLEDRLWSGEPTATSASALRTYLSKLRLLLGREAIQSSGRNIRLVPQRVVTDLDQLHRLRDDARRCAPGDPDQAVRWYDDALALFRGTPFMDVSGAALAASRVAIEQLRLEVEDERAAALVRSGRSEPHLNELEALVAAQPFREGRTATLMRALHAAGRRTEAIRAFHDLYRLLSDELGLRPGAEVVALEQSMLRDGEDDLPSGASGPIADHTEVASPDRAGPNVSEVMVAAALAGEVLDRAALLDVTGLSADELDAVLEVALAAGVLVPVGGSRSDGLPSASLRFADEHRRSTVLAAAPQPLRRNLTRRLATSAAIPRWRRALHLLELDDPLPVIADEVESAARAAIDAGAHEEAAALLQLFLEAMSKPSRRRAHEVDPATGARLRRLARAAFDLTGEPLRARKVVAELVDDALRAGDVRGAASALLGTAAVGRSYIADHEFSSMIRRCLMATGAAGSLPDARSADPLIVRLRGELLCREVLERGMDAEMSSIADWLRTALHHADDAARSAARCALMHVAVVRSTAPLDPDSLRAALADARVCGSLDDESDAHGFVLRAALEAAHPVRWRTAGDTATDFYVRSRRPVDLWSREAVRATDSQVRGSLQVATGQAAEARRIGARSAVTDTEIAWSAHLLASAMQAGTHSLEAWAAEIAGASLAELGALLVASYRADLGPDELMVAVLVAACCANAAPDMRNLSTIPSLAVSAQIVWNLRAESHAAPILAALSHCSADMAVAGVPPVACFGPMDRFRALMLTLLGRHEEAQLAFISARTVASRLRAHGWESTVLDDQAVGVASSGDPQRADRLRAEAARIRFRPGVHLGPR